MYEVGRKKTVCVGVKEPGREGRKDAAAQHENDRPNEIRMLEQKQADLEVS